MQLCDNADFTSKYVGRIRITHRAEHRNTYLGLYKSIPCSAILKNLFGYFNLRSKLGQITSRDPLSHDGATKY